MNTRLVKELTSLISKDKVLSRPEDLTCYSYDCSNYQNMPDAVVLADCRQDVVHTMTVAAKLKTPVVPRGSATNNCGATIPVQGGIVLDTLSMNKILEIDKENLTVTCQPGVITVELQAAVEKEGLFYPPDPQGLNMSSIGGNIALDAGGPRAVKYSVTRNYVLGLEIVLANGQVLRTGGKTTKDVSGYNLTQLLVGSEGTLGVFTEMTLKLLPQPEAHRTLICAFDNIADASRTVTKIIDHKIVPSMLELLDRISVDLIQRFMDAGYPSDAEAVLLIEVDGSLTDVDKQIDVVSRLCLECNAREIKIAKNAAEAEVIWAGRKSGFAALSAYKPAVLPEDAVVPRNKLPDMMAKVQAISKKYGMLLPTFGHAGDGNVHPHICFDPRNTEEAEKVPKIKDEIYQAALSLGGSISGEHGIGLAKRHLIPTQHRELNLGLMRGIKAVFDPDNILNPGKAF
ncbi:MAG TPA: FAD-linked oxidase C-terminal domain-containing protein [Nitrospirota bacterium]|nr:FAD-linked oxidase C-terminal domain-containing protein [Nitrospirota bacterium]